MAVGINGSSEVWEIHDYLTEKREETDQKYDYRYSVLLCLCSTDLRKLDQRGGPGRSF